jgi:hypothetical protein
MSSISSYINWYFPSSVATDVNVPDDSIKSEMNKKAEINVVRTMKV